jgi:RimJ/RimL family protein N-acetyltransferase
VIKIPSDEDILKVFRNPVVYDAVSSDSAPDIEDWQIDRSGNYVGYYVGDEIAGIWVYHDEGDGCHIHIQILPEYRKEYAKEAGKLFLDYTWECTDKDVLIAEIPELYLNVVKFTRSFGFRFSGIKESAYRKSGTDWDVFQLQLRRGAA